ncbi:Lipoate-protein ligase A [Chitinispirillum alkaliphilum]|nr:Lipoate-protein ligase A [Chitinispirillum alkaliphilum]
MRNALLRGNLKKNDALFMYGALCAKPYIHVYEQESVEVVHGPSCKPEDEIYLNRCSKDGVPVVERRGGGGTVVLSPGMLVTVIVGNRNTDQSPLEVFTYLHKAYISVLEQNGIENVSSRGISDLALDNKKILGSSLYMGRNPDYYYYQSCLMVESDISLLPLYLKHPPREPDYRIKRSHEEFCTTLKARGYNENLRNLKKAIREGLKKHLGEC